MKLLDTLFNLQERFHHKIHPGEIEFLRNNKLFSMLSDEALKRALHNMRFVKYSQGDCIVREGDPGTACYLIYEGEVGVYIRNIEGAKIQLVTLKAGDYFGEQILLGDSSATRNADAEAMTPVTLVYIGKQLLADEIKNNPELRLALIKRGYDQACANLTTATGFFNEISDLIPHLKNIPVVEFKKDEMIFETGDRPDYVYFVLRGEVELLQQIFSEDSPRLILHHGLLFGEKGALGYTGNFRNQRAISAAAHTDLRLLAVPSEDFKRAMQTSTQLKLLHSKLQKFYLIPMKGIAEQYFTNVQDLGPAITTIYRLEEHRTVISRLFILHDLFVMYVDNAKEAKHYSFENEVSKLEIDVDDHLLVRIKSTGVTEDILGKLCGMLLNREPIDRATFVQLKKLKT